MNKLYLSASDNVVLLILILNHFSFAGIFVG